MDYSNLVREHFFQPRNVGCFPIKTPNIYTVKRGEIGISDRVQLQLQLDASGRVVDTRFKAYGNPYTIAAMSWLTEQIKGQSLANVEITYQDMMEVLDVPKVRQASVLLVEDVLRSVQSSMNN